MLFILFLADVRCPYTSCLPHPFRDEELDTQVLQSSVQVACHLLVFLPGLLQPLEGDRDQWRYMIMSYMTQSQRVMLFFCSFSSTVETPLCPHLRFNGGINKDVDILLLTKDKGLVDSQHHPMSPKPATYTKLSSVQ